MSQDVERKNPRILELHSAWLAMKMSIGHSIVGERAETWAARRRAWIETELRDLGYCIDEQSWELCKIA